jgi:hypothetical protein
MVITYAGESVVSQARNVIADIFLKDTKAEYLFWIDSDIEWQTRDFIRIAGIGLDIVGAVYPVKGDPPRFMLEATSLVRDNDGLITVLGMGLGFTCVSRKVLITLARKAPTVQSGSPNGEVRSVKRIFHGAKDMGEDKNFFRDAINAEFEVKMCPDVILGHIGTKVYYGSFEEVLKHEGDNRIRDSVEPFRSC